MVSSAWSGRGEGAQGTSCLVAEMVTASRQQEGFLLEAVGV